MEHKIEVTVTVSIDGQSVTRTATVTTDGNTYKLADQTLAGVRFTLSDILAFPSEFRAAADQAKTA